MNVGIGESGVENVARAPKSHLLPKRTGFGRLANHGSSFGGRCGTAAILVAGPFGPGLSICRPAIPCDPCPAMGLQIGTSAVFSLLMCFVFARLRGCAPCRLTEGTHLGSTEPLQILGEGFNDWGRGYIEISVV